MKSIIFTLLASVATFVTAGPILFRRTAPKDATMLNYALAVEHLESAFYKQGLKNFTPSDFAAAGFHEKFYSHICDMSDEEADHVRFLTEAIKAAGIKPVSACTYSFNIASPKDFAAKAAILEGISVGAYLGAANEIQSPDTLAAAQAIFTTESHHTSLARKALVTSPFTDSNNYALSSDEVYTLLAPYISNCPTDDAQLQLKAFPRLELARYTRKPVEVDHTIILELPEYRIASHAVYAAFVTTNGPIFTNATVFEGGRRLRLKVPGGVQGQSYVVATSSPTEVSDGTTLAGPAVVDVGSWF